MDISELKGRVLQRFQELTDDEQMIAQTLKDSPVGEVILKLIGPELRQVFSEPEDETERMLADRANAMPQDLDREIANPVEFEGRSQGGNKVPPLRRPQIENRKGEKVLLRDSETGKAVIRDTDMREMASR